MTTKHQKSILFWTVVLFVVADCGPPMEKATVALIDKADASWRSHPVASYHIVVDVERPGELRRQDITIRDGKTDRAIVQYWNSKDNRWENTITLNQAQAAAFTVPGLLETVREELDNSRRPVIRVSMIQDPPYLEKIILGQVWQDNQAVPNSQASVIVRKFEKL